MISKKICLIGDFGVGKTSLIRRFVEQQFSDQYLSTVGVKISRKTLKPVNLQMLIWDLEGHTKFKAIAPTYLQGGSGAVIVADVSRQETVAQISEHIKLFLSVNPKGYIVIALNKVDLIEDEKLAKITHLVQLQYLEQVIEIYPTSAKKGLYVDEIFHKLAESIIA